MSNAKFVSGSLMKHIAVMTGASTLSLLAIFVVDLIDMFFLSLLGETELAAAVGYSGSILFFTTSIGIGLSIVSGALVSKSLGEENPERAKRYLVNIYVFNLLLTIPLAITIWLAVPYLLQMLGAGGRALELATSYLRIIIPSMPVLAIAMASNGALRALGDAKRSMFAMLAGSIVNAILDPIFIFALELGVDGAAYASVAARFAILYLSFRAVRQIHQMTAPFSWHLFRSDIRSIFRIALPAILTNIATPIGNAYVTSVMAGFGDGAVAGNAIISRVAPVAFCAVFAMSGSLGPIIGQNFGAKRFDRIGQALFDAMKLTIVYVIAIWIVLLLGKGLIVTLFNAEAAAAELIFLFCSWISLSFIFNGATFATNAAFNNLGRAHYATLFNFGKATLGTIPFVYLGSLWLGAAGALIGQAIGSVIFGVFGMTAFFIVLRRLEKVK